MNLSQNTDAFWTWFKESSVDLLKEPVDEWLINCLDEKMLMFHGVTWEVGPTYPPNLKYFAVSPNLRLDLVPLCQSIVNCAPAIESWRFYLYRQPKVDWIGKFSLLLESGRLLHIDVSNWQFLIYQYDDKKFEIDIYNIESSYFSFGSAIFEEICELALLHILGEEIFMKYLLKFEPFKEGLATSSLNFVELSDFFRNTYN